jgi:hypothetical protein
MVEPLFYLGAGAPSRSSFAASAEATGIGPHCTPRCIVCCSETLYAGHSGNPVAFGFPVAAKLTQ